MDGYLVVADVQNGMHKMLGPSRLYFGLAMLGLSLTTLVYTLVFSAWMRSYQKQDVLDLPRGDEGQSFLHGPAHPNAEPLLDRDLVAAHDHDRRLFASEHNLAWTAPDPDPSHMQKLREQQAYLNL